jgi:superfamily II DNA/RNA helicase
MSDAQREEHDALVLPIVQLMKRGQRRPLTQAEFLRLMSLLTTQRIIANGMAQHRFQEVWPQLERTPVREGALAGLASPKLAELRALVSALAVDQGRKIVVFSQWRRMLRLAAWAVEDVLAEGGLRAAFFTGEESQKQRTRNLVDFHDDPAARVLFATDAGGVGLNLQRAANACITCDLPWNPAVLEQRIGRIHRLGQTDPIDVYSLVSQDSIESRIARLVSDKRALFRGLFDGESDAVRFDRSGSFLASLERLFADAHEPPGEEDDEDELEEEAQLAEDTLPAAPPRAPSPAQQSAVSPASVSSRAAHPVAPPALEAMQALFMDLAIQRTPQGRVRVEVSQAVAAGLASLLQGLAQTLLETESLQT